MDKEISCYAGAECPVIAPPEEFFGIIWLLRHALYITVPVHRSRPAIGRHGIFPGAQRILPVEAGFDTGQLPDGPGPVQLRRPGICHTADALTAYLHRPLRTLPGCYQGKPLFYLVHHRLLAI